MSKITQILNKRSVKPVETVTSENVQSDALRFASQGENVVARYMKQGEVLVGSGYGGSESMTLFLESEGQPKFVRKILSEGLISPKWNRQGTDVMLAPCAKAKRQTRYLLGLPESVKPFFPKVLDVVERDQKIVKGRTCKTYKECIYDMTFIPGMEVSQFVRKYQPSKEIVAALYQIIFQLLNQRIHSQRRRSPNISTLEQSYFSKIEKRLKLSQKTAPHTFGDHLLKADEIMLNGKKMRNIPTLLKQFRENPTYLAILEPKFHCLVMGDTNTENIKIGNVGPLLADYENFSVANPPFSAEDLEIRFLDPRSIGFHENGVDTESDDHMYDNKPWHNSLGNYDKIHGEHFDLAYQHYEGIPHLLLAFHESNPYQSSYEGIDQYFKTVMTSAWALDNPYSDINQNDPHWLVRFAFLMGTHFAAMPPFHFSQSADGALTDDPICQRRPIAVYVEGVKWLNLALNMLEGKVREFGEFTVPDYSSL